MIAWLRYRTDRELYLLIIGAGLGDWAMLYWLVRALA